jgi:hypothetical protein
MKTSILFVAITACALSSIQLASAQDKDAPAKPEMSMPMDAKMSQMQDNMTKMKSQMDKIHATTDPKARQALMQAHMQTMQECMAMMGQMNKPMMMGGGQGAGMAMGGDKGMAGDKGMMGSDMMQHHQMMEKRMSMMQMMMEQMLQHQQAMESTPAK